MMLPQLFAHRLAFERLHVKVVGFGRHDEEDHHRQIVPVHLGVQQEDTREEKGKNNVRLVVLLFSLHVVHWETHPEEVVESRQRLQENIGSFVGKFVASGDEKEQGLVQVEVQVPARGAVLSTLQSSGRFLQTLNFQWR